MGIPDGWMASGAAKAGAAARSSLQGRSDAVGREQLLPAMVFQWMVDIEAWRQGASMFWRV